MRVRPRDARSELRLGVVGLVLACGADKRGSRQADGSLRAGLCRGVSLLTSGLTIWPAVRENQPQLGVAWWWWAFVIAWGGRTTWRLGV